MKRTIADRIRERRIELRLTQATLGEALGCGQESVSQWEKEGPSTLRTIERIAYALFLQPAWLAYGVGPKVDKEAGCTAPGARE